MLWCWTYHFLFGYMIIETLRKSYHPYHCFLQFLIRTCIVYWDTIISSSNQWKFVIFSLNYFYSSMRVRVFANSHPILVRRRQLFPSAHHIRRLVYISSPDQGSGSNCKALISNIAKSMSSHCCHKFIHPIALLYDGIKSAEYRSP